MGWILSTGQYPGTYGMGWLLSTWLSSEAFWLAMVHWAVSRYLWAGYGPVAIGMFIFHIF